MTTKTRRELVDQALENIGALPAGQVASNEDVAHCDGKVPLVLEMLSAEGVVTIPDDEEIESAYFLPISIILTEHIALAHGRAADPVAIDAAKAQIRRVTWAGPTYETTQADYF